MDWNYHAFLSVFAGLLLLIEAQINQPPTWVAASVNPLARGFSEAIPIGTFLTQLRCIDPENDPIRYDLQSGKAVRVFSNGTVTLALQLDYEPKDPIGYDLTFTCTDVSSVTGAPLHAAVPINAQISVNDANDNPPVFQVNNTEGYSFTVREDAPIGTVVESSIRTVDIDKSVNAVLKAMYIICNSTNPAELANLTDSSREMCDKFKLTYAQESEGVYRASVTLIAPLDYETRPVYISKLIAIDGPGVNNVSFTTTVNIQIQVIDTQDVLPLFTNPGASTTVSEGAAVGSIINFGISARDGDTGDRRPIALSIIQDPKNAFNLTNSTLVSANDGIYEAKLVVRNQLDRETNLGAYEFVVKATEIDKDTLQLVMDATATATYSVFVTDINDNAPTFSQNVYVVNVTEMESNTVNGSVQITGLHIICSDPDEPSNAQYQVRVVSQVLDATGQQIQAYSISPGVNFTGNASMFLKVDQPLYLDYDNPNYRIQTVLLRAEQINTPEKFTGSTTISIFLQDINDNAPDFDLSEYEVSISEESTPPLSILQIHAADRDAGLNGQVTYRLDGGYFGKFSINSTTGVLSLIDTVDYETTPEYVFLVYATDRSAQPRSSQVQVTVHILNYNDEGPLFRQALYQTSANESSLHFLNPLNITAVDDEDDGQPITYRIVSGQTPNNAFVLNRLTGELTLQNFLNYDDTPRGSDGEHTGVFILTVEASDNGNPPQTNQVQVRVTVIDENNHAPVLNPTVYNRVLSELAPPGTSVAQITGTDDDGGDNGKISYRVGEGLSDNFFVDPDSGLITVGQNPAFDFNVQTSYRLVIIATDGGAPQKSASATVNVDITDANNKDPYFADALYVQNVDEKTPVNTVVLPLSAIDTDSTANLEYSIVPDSISATDSNGNTLTSTYPYDYRQAFGVNANGGIYVKSALSKEATQEITFQLMVRDKNTQSGTGTGTTQITLTISGEAASGIFFDPVNRVFMNEDATVGYDALTVTARDLNNNAVSNYEKLAGSSNNFAVDRTTGTISLVTPIDYEKDTSPDHLHRVIVKAVSRDGTESATVTATISIVDVNDNAPVFQRTQYVAEVSENARYPTTVITIAASDADSRSYGPLSFRIAGGLDSDDFAIFHEPVPIGTQTTRRAEVIVAQGKELNYNRRSHYDLDLVVGDNEDLIASNNRLYGTAKLIINIIDENNNPPKFKENETGRALSVPETAEIGRSIATIIATDEDIGRNGEILYTLESTAKPDSLEGLTLFSISPQLGTVNVAGSLLGKGNKVYPMIVRATDRGEPPNSATLKLNITVLSTEDDDGNPKWRLPPNGYVVYAPEETANYTIADSDGNTRFFDVVARTGTNITFELSPYNPFASSFRINPITGEITIIDTRLDRELQETYNLLVYAQDTIDPLKYRSGRQLTLKLTDKNDNSASFTSNYTSCPKIDRPVMTIYVRENTEANTTVATVRACDPDGPGNNAITYTLFDENDYCKENNGLSGLRLETDGKLITKRLIDYEQDREFKMCVRAISVIPVSGVPGRKKRSFNETAVRPFRDDVAYILVVIVDENDNGPKFPDSSVVAVVQTDPGTGPAVSLNAADPDGSGKNAILYRIENSVFFPQGGGAPQRFVGAFTLRGDKAAIYPALPSYQEFAGGRFELEVVAVDSTDNAFQDREKITIYVYEKGQSAKLILNLKPDDGFSLAKPLVERLDAVSNRYTFVYKQVSEHVSQDGIDPDKTDVCFIAIDSVDHNILNIRQVVELLDRSEYSTIWDKDEYNVVDRGQCYPSQSSEKNIRWRDLWWVLVAVGIFLFICCVILIVLISILYDRYKRYMETRKTYLVSQ